MKAGSSLVAYFAKVAATTFVAIVVLAVVIGMALSFYSQATDARVSAGAFFLQAEDFFWIVAISIVVGAVAAVVRHLRRT
jgi:hypothetical protein